MSSHSVHTMPASGPCVLFDFCERCEEIAHDPGSGLDNESMIRLWAFAQEGICNSIADALAVENLHRAMRLADRLRELVGTS